MNPRTVIVIMLVAGIAIGATAAVVDRGQPTRTIPSAASASAIAERVPLTVHGPVKVVARAGDPGGAAPWAVRRFVASQPGAERSVCVQLGRLDGRRFGWIAPGAPWRPAQLDLFDVPTICEQRLPGGLPQLDVTTLTTDASAGLPKPDRTVIWGVLPEDATRVRLRDGTNLKAGAHRVVLAVQPGRRVGEPHVAGTLWTSHGGTRAFAYSDPEALPRRVITGRRHAARPRRDRGGTPLRDSERISVRVPDPAGGAAWGIVTARSNRGNVCITQPGRVVGDRPASLDPRLAVAGPQPFVMFDCSARWQPTAARPIRTDAALMAIGDEDPVGTQQLRRLTNRTILYGRTTSDVTAVTINTSRDIRTITPDPRTHLILAVYDGTFPNEPFKVTATLRTGRHVTTLQRSGG